MFDLNTILFATIKSAIDAATADLRQQIADLEKRLIDATASGPVDGIDLTSAVFVGAVEAIAERVSEAAIGDHTSEYDHDEFMDRSVLEEEVRDAVNSMTFEISVS